MPRDALGGSALSWKRIVFGLVFVSAAFTVVAPAGAAPKKQQLGSAKRATARVTAAERQANAVIRRVLEPNGHVHILPAPGAASEIRAARAAAGVPARPAGLGYEGGPVMADGVRSVPIFWEPPLLQDGTTEGYVVPGYEDGIVQYLNDVGGSRWLHTITQYYEDSADGRTYISDASGVLQAVIDRSPYPAAGPDCVGGGQSTNCLDYAQIVAEISKVRADNQLPGGYGTMYQLFTERDEASCFPSSFGYQCSMQPRLTYCAYHTAFTDTDGQLVIFSVDPYAGAGGCSNFTSTFVNSQDLDLARLFLGHEISEAATDPIPSGGGRAWVSGFEEVADLCAQSFGFTGRDSRGLANQVFNGTSYYQQMLWDNSVDGCAAAGPGDAGGAPAAFAAGAWTHITVGDDAARGLPVSKRDVDPAMAVVATASSPDASKAYLVDGAAHQLRVVDEPGIWLEPEPLPLSTGAASIAVTPDGATALIPNGSDGTLTVVDLATMSVRATVATGGTPVDVVVTPNGSAAWIADDTGSLRLLTLSNLKPGRQIALPGSPGGLALSPSGTDAYVTLPDGRLRDMILSTGKVRWSRPTGVTPSSRPAVTPDGRDVLTVDHATGTLFATLAATGAVDRQLPVGAAAAVTATAGGNALVLTSGSTNRSLIPVTIPGFVRGQPLRAEADSATIAPLPSQPPVAALNAPATKLGLATRLDASASTSDYGVASYQWSFGDGSTATTTTPVTTHTYTTTGTFTVTITLTDRLGVSTTGTVYDGHQFLRRAAGSARATATTTVLPATAPELLAATTQGLTPVYTHNPTLIGTPISVQGRVEDFVISPDGRTAYVVTTTPSNRLIAVDTQTGAVGWSQALPDTATAIALSADGATAYLTVAGGVVPVNIPTHTVAATIPVGDATTYLVDIALTPNGQSAFVIDYSTNLAYPVTLASRAVGEPISIGGYESGLAITPNGSRLLVPNFYGGAITPVDVAAMTAGTPIDLGRYPQDVAVTPDGSTLLASGADTAFNDDGTKISAINLMTNTVGTTVSLPRTGSACVDPRVPAPGLCIPAPVTVAMMPSGTTAYAGVVADDAIIPIAVSGLNPGTSVLLPGQLGAVRAIPAQAPTAKFTAAKPTGRAIKFNGGGSSSPNGTIASWTWNFGDGTPAVTTTSPTITHTYAAAGSYTVSLTVTDSAGVSSAIVAGARQLLRNGGATARTSQPVTVG